MNTLLVDCLSACQRLNELRALCDLEFDAAQGRLFNQRGYVGPRTRA